MSEERWRPVPGFALHEQSSLGRVRTTAVGTSGVSVGSLFWLLLPAAVAVAIYKAQLVNAVANAVAVGLCAIPAAWILRQLCGEARFAWEVRRYARRTRPAPLALTARAPLAIEAARPNPTFIIEHDGMRMDA
jgi:hypothetical protein